MALDRFAAEQSAISFKNPMFNDIIPEGVATTKGLSQMIDRIVSRNDSIVFNMKGIQNVAEILEGADYGSGFISFELRYLCTSPAARAVTKFHNGPAPC